MSSSEQALPNRHSVGTEKGPEPTRAAYYRAAYYREIGKQEGNYRIRAWKGPSDEERSRLFYTGRKLSPGTYQTAELEIWWDTKNQV